MNKHCLATLSLAVAAAFAARTATAQTLPVALNYNFNGIVHAGESGNPDDPAGFRSISDRALDFSNGVPVDPLLNSYQVVTTAGALDIVHLGNRNTVDNGNWAFDATPDGDDIGIQPTWLTVVDQSTPQTTSVVSNPIPILDNTEITFLYQISNGGASFDVTFDFFSGQTFTTTMSAGDWFGGPYPGTGFVDSALPDNNLSLTETRVDMSAFLGDVVSAITFENSSSTTAGIAIVGCNVVYGTAASRVNNIPLTYNFNGIVHAGESGNPDDPNGFRSISDRALDFSAGAPTDPIYDGYSVVLTPGALDIVHLGNRNTVNGGGQAFDLTVDGDDIGIQPTWLANADQTGPQVTTLANQIMMDASSEASLLFQVSNGGGSFDVEFRFAAGAPLVVSVSGPDWFGGVLPGTQNTDNGFTGNNLSLTERIIDLSTEAGRTLTGIAFQNRSNGNAGYAIVAMNVVGCVRCANGSTAAINNLGGGSGATIATNSDGHLGCDLDWTVSGASPSALGLWAIGIGQTSVPLSVVTPGCPGTIRTPNPVLLGGTLDASGSATLVIEMPVNQALCGASFTAQHAELAPGSCFIVLSDALNIRVGN